MDSSIGHGKFSERLMFGLLFLILIALIVWPSYRTVTLASVSAITRPLTLLFHKAESQDSVPAFTERRKKGLQKGDLAVKARSMEFRIQQYFVNPDAIHKWSQEWDCGPVEKLVLLKLLLHQLPEAFAKESSVLQQHDLVRVIMDLASEGRALQPDNAFFPFAEALTLFYSGKDAAAILSLKQAQNCSHKDAGLKELNRSEYELWRQEGKPWILLPTTQRAWELDLERPLHALSRGLNLQQRTLLQKYNMERAVELALIQLGLAAQISQTGWTPADQAIARAIANHALDPFWTQREVVPTSSQLEENLIHFLEDQGDKLAMAKVDTWISTLVAREKAQVDRSIFWRRIQAFTLWNASSVIGSLLLQTASLLIVWITVVVFADDSFSKARLHFAPYILVRYGLTSIAFAIAPIAWTFCSWPPGSVYMIFGLILGWGLWWSLIMFLYGQPSLSEIRGFLVEAVITMSIATLLTISTVAAVLQYRQRYLDLIVSNGWLG